MAEKTDRIKNYEYAYRLNRVKILGVFVSAVHVWFIIFLYLYGFTFYWAVFSLISLIPVYINFYINAKVHVLDNNQKYVYEAGLLGDNVWGRMDLITAVATCGITTFFALFGLLFSFFEVLVFFICVFTASIIILVNDYRNYLYVKRKVDADE